MRFNFPRILLVSFVLLATCARPNFAATPQEVENAIKKAKEYLYSQMKDGTRWEPDPARAPGGDWGHAQGYTWGGWTALCTYALLIAGESPQDPRIAKAIEFLIKADVNGVYVIGLRAQVWNLIPSTPEVRRARDNDLKLLEGAIDVKPGPLRGLYGYDITGSSRHNSPSQYGVLGMWALEQQGCEIGTRYWDLVDATWKKNQQPNGGWTYQVPGKPEAVSSSMTAAGIATLFITQDYLKASEGVACKGNIVNVNIDAGLKWMAAHFSPGWPMYDLYGVERIGVASGYKYFGDKDWYKLGAEQLVRTQAPDGLWATGGIGALPLTNTAFGLVFLSRGRAPIMMNKLSYNLDGKEANWNQRPRDVANLAKWDGKQTERFLNWQIVNLQVPVQELHDAPILYISGNQDLKFPDPEKAKLKQFVEEGGIILANSDCSTTLFNSSYQKLGEELFPGYKFRELPEEHPIYKNENYKRLKWRNKPSVLSLSNGCRELMILIPANDPAKAWQTQAVTREELYQLPADIFLYAVDKQELRTKGDTYILTPDPAIKADRTMKVARLKYDGNWNPEPGGWRRLTTYMHNTHKLDLTVDPIPLGEGKLTGYKIAHITGTEKFRLKDAARKEIKTFIAGGGTLIVDAAGGDTDFAESAKSELEASLGDARELSEPLKASHDVYHLVDSQIQDVAYRNFARQSTVGRMKGPLLRGISSGKRTAVFFSREDLSVGLVGQPVDGILGYTPQSATSIMANALLYGSGEGKVAPPAAPAAATTAPVKH